MSNPIGEFFGGKHHSTVIHAIQTVEDIIPFDASVKNKLKELKTIVSMKIDR